MELVEYLDTARARSQMPSDTKLSIVLGASPTWAHMVRTGKMLPSEEAMLRLADLAGVAPDIALLDLQRIRARDPRVRSVWRNIAQRLAVAGIACLLWQAPASSAPQSTQGVNSPCGSGLLYIIKNRIARFSRRRACNLGATLDNLCPAW